MAVAPGVMGAKPKGKLPNIVFIIVDDMGYHDLGCYGSKTIQTPNLDRMAKEGMRFTHAYSGCTVCAPARSTLMTGFHMGHTSVRGNSGGVSLLTQDVTVAEVLKKAGYICGGFGKWGLGDTGTCGVPEKKGFDEFFGYYHQVHAHYYYTDYLWRNGVKVPLPANEGWYKAKPADKKPESELQYTQHVIFDEMKKWLLNAKGHPFFCYAPWTPPHSRYEMPPNDPAWALYKDKPWKDDAKVAAAMDTMIDRHVGEVLDTLKNLGVDDKTIVFFCSDNGAAKRFDGTHNSCGIMKGFKRSMYEGGIRVPMIVRWPGKVKAGAVSNHPWYFPDVMPTLAELAGVTPKVPKGVDGISVVPTLLGERKVGRPQAKAPYMYWEDKGGAMQAIRVGNLKLLRNKASQKYEMYDVVKDMGEKDDLATKRPREYERMIALIKTARVDAREQKEPPREKGKRYN